MRERIERRANLAFTVALIATAWWFVPPASTQTSTSPPVPKASKVTAASTPAAARRAPAPVLMPRVSEHPVIAPHVARRSGAKLAAPVPYPTPRRSTTSARVVATAAPEDDAPPVRKTKFHNLRFEEDWTWVDDPDVLSDHALPDAKSIPFGDGWSASFGGQIRYRLQAEKNKTLMGTSPEHNDFNLSRVRAHMDLRHEDGYRLFIEGIDARIHGNERPALGIDRNNADFLNAFVEAGNDDLTARLGRMELQQGRQRLISPLDWANTRRTFQGGMLRVNHESAGSTDVFVTKPVIIDPRDSDDTDSSRWFMGIYNSRQLESGDNMDLFGLFLNETDPLFMSGNGHTGDMELYTVGARFGGKSGQTDYELWAAKQFGKFATDDIDAWAATGVVGHSFPDAPGKPRVGVSIDYASGDSDPTDDETETFNQLFPLGHAYFGYLDLIGRQNIVDLSPNVAVKLHERVGMKFAAHFFRLAEENDAVYNVGGAPGFADTTGDSGKNVGKEFDVTLSYTPECLAPHGHVLVGYSRFLAGRRIDSNGGDGDADLFYTQFTMTF